MFLNREHLEVRERNCTDNYRKNGLLRQEAFMLSVAFLLNIKVGTLCPSGLIIK